jgi:hypothetical protein
MWGYLQCSSSYVGMRMNYCQSVPGYESVWDTCNLIYSRLFLLLLFLILDSSAELVLVLSLLI